MPAQAARPAGQWPGHDARMTRGQTPYPPQSPAADMPGRMSEAPHPTAPAPGAHTSAGWYGQAQPYAGQPVYAAQPNYAGAAPMPHAAYEQPPGHAQPAHAQSGAVAPVSMAGLARGFGAVTSLVLLIGGGIWTWQMMQRDVSGVPVVRALEGPLRVAPENPGGMQAAHQGLSVNELAADGASDMSDEIVLAPQPLDLDAELSRPARDSGADGAPESLIEVGLPAPGAGPAAAAPAEPAAPQPALGFVSPNRSAVTRSPRPAPRQAGLVARQTSPQASSQAAPQAGAAASAEPDLAAAVANSVAADLSRESGIDVDPASIGPGTRLVQLGAFDTSAEARAAWDALAQRFNPLLDDRGRVIEAAHSGGSVFYRLRAHGFSDERDARRFCAALIDQRLDCIPVLIR